MSTSASSLNWWYIDGSLRRMTSAGSRLAISRNTPPCGEPRPALTSELIARATSSRGSRSGVRRFFSWSVYQRSASSSLSAYWPLNTSGTYSNMNRLSSEFLSTPPSPRTFSVTRMPFTLGGHTIPVGWNCTNSMLISFAPAEVALADAPVGRAVEQRAVGLQLPDAVRDLLGVHVDIATGASPRSLRGDTNPPGQRSTEEAGRIGGSPKTITDRGD